MKRQGRSRARRVAIAAAVLVVGTGGGLGWAWWTTTGDGSTAASTGTDTAWDVDVDSPAGSLLTPGGPTQTIDFTITNNSSGHQKLALVTVAVKNADGSAWAPAYACDATDYTVSVTTAPAYTDVAPGGTRTGQATLQMVNKAGNQDGCKGATVPLYFHAS